MCSDIKVHGVNQAPNWMEEPIIHNQGKNRSYAQEVINEGIKEFKHDQQ